MNSRRRIPRDALKPLLRTAYRSLGWMGTDRTPAVAEDSCDWAAPIWWRTEADRTCLGAFNSPLMTHSGPLLKG